MLTDEELTSLPDDKELAFAEFERLVRDKIEKELADTQSGDHAAALRQRYINAISAAAKSFEIESIMNLEDLSSNIYQAYDQFLLEVDHCVWQIRINNSRRQRGFSVKLDGAARQKIRFFIDQIKGHIDGLDVSERKKDALFARINAFLKEVDRDRTKFESGLAMIVELAGATGQSAEKLGPLKDALDSIWKIFSDQKDLEESRPAQIPAPEERKRIEPPRKGANSPTKHNELGDDGEIPF